ncbi:MAG: hypothetical protein P8Z68_03325, partial [Kineosporiaceae bacterium]
MAAARAMSSGENGSTDSVVSSDTIRADLSGRGRPGAAGGTAPESTGSGPAGAAAAGGGVG